MSAYVDGTAVLVGTDPSLPGLADTDPPTMLFQTAAQAVADPTGTVQGTDPTTVEIEYGWFTLVTTVWTQKGVSVRDTYPNIGTQINRSRTGGYSYQIDTTGHGGQWCKGFIRGTGACQADQPFSFPVIENPILT